MDKQDVRSCAKVLLVVLGIVIMSKTVSCEPRDVSESSCKLNNNACDPTGTCLEPSGVCKCAEGYTGERCQYKMVNCTDEANCTDDQVCTETFTSGKGFSVKCVCSQIRYGNNCEYERQCLRNPCVRGRCEEDFSNIYRYKCLCHDGYTGHNCDEVVSVGTGALEMRPKQGPIAGGTRVTFMGNQNLLGSVDNITIDGVGSFTIPQHTNTSVGMLFARTPPFPNETDTGLDVTVKVHLNSTVITRTFTYKPNPTVSYINPRKLIQSGGTNITVTGTNLEVVGDPILTITAVQRLMKNKTNEIKSQRCNSSEMGDILICTAPNIPKNLFEDKDKQKRSIQDQSISVLKQAVRRLRREEPEDKQDNVHFIIGLQLDGVQDYTDFTQHLPDLAFADVNPDPTFKDGQIFYVEDGGESQIIGIKGENVDSGVVEYYTVLIGSANCDNIGLTTDKLYCYPPPNLHEIGESDIRNNNEAYVTVKVGDSITYRVGYVVYEKVETVSLMKVFVPVVAAIGAVLLIIIIILIVCACKKRQTKTEQKQRILPPPSSTDIQNMTQGGNDNYYTGTGQSAAPNPYYMVVNGDGKH